MGDVVCMLPMMKEVQIHYPNAELTVLINNSYIKDILYCSGLNIHSVRVLNVHTKRIDAIIQCLRLRGEKFDLAIASAITPVKKSKLFMCVINAKKTVGIQFSLGKHFDTLCDKYHFVQANMLALQQLNLKHQSPDISPKLYARNEDVKKFIREHYFEKSLPVVCICVGRGYFSYTDESRKHTVYTRGWGSFAQHVKNMKELAELCLAQGWTVILMGGSDEKEISEKIKVNMSANPKLIDVVGKTTVAESIAITSICRVQVGMDTGMQHVADAVGVQTVSVFGPTNPRTHGAYSSKGHFVESYQSCKYCYGTSQYVDCTERKCLESISVKMVFEQVKALVC